MIPPSVVLAFVLSSLYGLMFYVAFGRGWARLAVYWLVGIAGFAAGQWLGSLVGLGVLTLGPLYLLEATAVSWASLLAVKAWRR